MLDDNCTIFSSASWLSPTLGCCALCLAVYLIWIRIGHSHPGKKLPPGSFGWPIIGETAAFIIDGKKFMRIRTEKHGAIFKTSILGVPTVVVSGAQNVEPVLNGEGRSVHVSLPTSARTLFGRYCLCRSSGDRHHTLHRLVTRIFSPATLQEVTPLIHDVVKEFVAKWYHKGHVESGVDELLDLSFSVAIRVLLPLNFNKDEAKNVRDLFTVFNDAFFSFPVNLPGFAFKRGMEARRKLVKIISRRVEELVNDQHQKNISLLLKILKCCNDMKMKSNDSDDVILERDENDEMTEEFQNLSLEFVFASFQTTASTLCAIAICLAEHPEVRQRVLEELHSLHLMSDIQSDTDNVITYADVTAASYVNDVMKEVLRIMPPVAGSFRKTLQPIELAGYYIPEGWSILYTIPTTHFLSNNRTFEDSSLDFRPERWRENNSESFDTEQHTHHKDKPEQRRQRRSHLDRFKFIPFGGGIRNCVGREFAKMVLRLFIIEMVRSGSWTLVNGPPEMITAPLPFPRDKLPLKFMPSFQTGKAYP